MKTLAEYKRGTKVLIIISIILLVIIIILLFRYNNLKTRNNQKRLLEIEARQKEEAEKVLEFNSRFDDYIGPNQDHNELFMLISNIMAINNKFYFHDKCITINDMDVNEFKSKGNRVHYNIKAEYDCEGYINNFVIEEVN